MSEFWSPFFNKSDAILFSILYVLFFRLGFMLDHEKDEKGNLRLNYSKNIKKYLEEKKIELVVGNSKKSIPVIVYLQCVETFLIADDVYMFPHSKDWMNNDKAKKVYDNKGVKDTRMWKNGRINTALTFCNVVRCSFGGGDITLMPKLLENMGIKRGMSEISRQEFIERLEKI